MRSSASSFSMRETERTPFVHRARSGQSRQAFGVAVVDLLEIAQPAVAERLQRLPGGADVGVAPGVVAELVLAEKAIAHR
jgi:hypothetical protein